MRWLFLQEGPNYAVYGCGSVIHNAPKVPTYLGTLVSDHGGGAVVIWEAAGFVRSYW